MKKNIKVKKILLGTMSIVGVASMFGAGLILANNFNLNNNKIDSNYINSTKKSVKQLLEENPGHTYDPKTEYIYDQNGQVKMFAGEVLLLDNSRALGWESKSTITLADWESSAPNVIQLGEAVNSAPLLYSGPFYNFASLNSIQIPDQINIFGSSAFMDSAVKEIVFSPTSNLEQIFSYSFTNVRLTTTVYFPRSLQRINTSALVGFRNAGGILDLSNCLNLNFIGQTALYKGGEWIRTLKLPNVTSGITLQNIFNWANFDAAFVADWWFPEFLKPSMQSWAPSIFADPTLSSALNWYPEKFLGIILTNQAVLSLGWDKKTSITLEDWISRAPNVTQIGSPTASTTQPGPFFENRNLTSIAIPDKIKTIGWNTFANAFNLATVTISDTSTLTTIGPRAFYGIFNLFALSLPDTLETVGEFAFHYSHIEVLNFGTTALKSVGNQAFGGMRTIKTLIFPDRTDITLGNSLFTDAESLGLPILKNFRISQFYQSSVSRWGAGLSQTQINGINWYPVKFLGTILTKQDVINLGWDKKAIITLDDWTEWAPNVIQISSYNTPTPDINNSAFFNNNILTSIAIPDKIKIIGDYSFINNFQLSNIAISPTSELTAIGYRALYGTHSLWNFSPPQTLQRVDEDSFKFSHINTLDFSNTSLAVVGNHAFAGMNRLTSIIFPNTTSNLELQFGTAIFSAFDSPGIPTLVNIQLNIFYQQFIGTWGTGLTPTQIANIKWYPLRFLGTTLTLENATFLGWNRKATITLEDWVLSAPNVTQISGAFFRNNTLTSIAIPDQITIIGSNSFANAFSLTSITFSQASQLTSIGSQALMNTRSLTTFTPPRTLESIANQVFQFSGVRTLDFSNTALNNVGFSAFGSMTSLTSIIFPNRTDITLGSSIFSPPSAAAPIINIQLSGFYFANGQSTWGTGLTQAQYDAIKWYPIKYLGNNLTQEAVFLLGWDKKEVITLADWAEWAPNVNSISLNIESEFDPGAFRGNTTLTSIAIPNKVTTIGWFAFANAFSVTNITFSPGSQLKQIGPSAFYGLHNLLNLSLPNAIEIIGSSAFKFSHIRILDFSNTLLKSVDVSAFAGMARLESIIFPNRSSFTLGNSLFSAFDAENGSPLLNNLQISRTFQPSSASWTKGLTPTQVANINWYPMKFFGTILQKQDVINLTWDKKESITLADWTEWAPNVTQIGGITVAVEDSTPFANNSIIKNIAIPNKIEWINSFAFQNSSLSTITWDNENSKLNNIGRNAFDGTNLQGEITLPKTIVQIQQEAFSNIESLTSIKFSSISNLTSIGTNAFKNTKLTSIELPNKIGITLGSSIFGSAGMPTLTRILANRSLFPSLNVWGEGLTATQKENIIWYPMEITDLNPSNFATGITFSGTTKNVSIVEDSSLYLSRVAGFTDIADAKKYIEIKYRLNSNAPYSDAKNASDFTTYLNSLTGSQLNDLKPEEFVANYFFTDLGITSFTSQFFVNSLGTISSSINGIPNSSNLIKIIDLNSFILKIADIQLTGTIRSINYNFGAFDEVQLRNLGVKIEWNYWINDPSNGQFKRNGWTETKPTNVAVLNNPYDTSNDNFPIAIRFGLIDSNAKIELKNIVNNVVEDPNITKGYEPNITNLAAQILLIEKIGINYKFNGLAGNVVSMNIGVRETDVSPAASVLEVQFAMGPTSANGDLIIPWANATKFKTDIISYSKTNDFLKANLNIYAKLILKGGTGENNDILNGNSYSWDKEIVEIYNNDTGVNGSYSISPAGSKIRAYAKIIESWSNPLSAEGLKSSAVKIFDKGNAFDIAYYQARGISLEVSVDQTTWTPISEFGAQEFDASATNQMNYRLNIVDPVYYEMYSTTLGVIETTSPFAGIKTVVITKEVIAKKILTGILANNLVTGITLTGSTHRLVINENDSLYTNTGLSLADAKLYLSIKYTYNNNEYFTKEEFIAKLLLLDKVQLNDLNLVNFKVKYEFTALGLKTYFSDQVSNDPTAIPADTIKTLNTAAVVKTIDLNTYITEVASVVLTGNSNNIVYDMGTLDAEKLTSLGVKIQWNYWINDEATGGYQRNGWTDTRPTSVAILNNPTNPDGLYPVAINFVKIDSTNAKIELKNIVNNTADDLDVKGYEPNISNLKEQIILSEVLGTNYKFSGLSGSLTNLVIAEQEINVSNTAKINLEVQFSMGSSSVDSNLIIPWSNSQEFSANLATYIATNDVLKSNMNIYAKLILRNGEGPNADSIGDIRYVWNKEIVEIYNNVSGSNSLYSTDTSGSKIRAYAKVESIWSDPLSAEGDKSTAVKILNANNTFIIDYYTARGISLEVSVNQADWTTITAFDTEAFDASSTNQMSYRLIIKDVSLFQMHGAVVQPSTPEGTVTKIVTKKIIARVEMTGIIATNLANLITFAQNSTTHDLNVIEPDSLYTDSGLSLVEAKKYLMIKYTFDGTNYLSKADFEATLKGLRGEELNNLNFVNFKVKYEFTELGLQTYYSDQVSNDPQANPAVTIQSLKNVTLITKTIDVTSQISWIRENEVTGTTENLIWPTDTSLLERIAAHVDVYYGTYQRKAGTEELEYVWSTTRPTSLVTNIIPEGQTNFPLAIRFMPKQNSKVEIGLIEGTLGIFTPANTVDGYEMSTRNITSIINIDTTELVNKIILTGYSNDFAQINGGASAAVIEQEALKLVDPLFRDNVSLVYEISIRPNNWYTFDQLKAQIISYSQSLDNISSGLLFFQNQLLDNIGTGINVKFISKSPNFSIVATPNEITKLNTSGIKTSVDLIKYVEVLRTTKIIPSGNSSANVGTLTLPSMPIEANTLFSGKTFLEIRSILSSRIDIQFRAPGPHDAWGPLEDIKSLNFENEIFVRFVVLGPNKSQMELSLITNNDYEAHLTTGFKLPIALPIEIQVIPNDLIRLITLTGNTKKLVIDDSSVYTELNAKNPLYENKVQVLYSIGGNQPIALDPLLPEKTEFSKSEFIRLLSLNTNNITLAQKQITARYALADGINPDDWKIKDETRVNLDVNNILLFINKDNYYNIAKNIIVTGSSSSISWSPELNILINALPEGLKIQYSTDSTATGSDEINSTKWTTTQPTTINTTTKFLALRLVADPGYIFEDAGKMQIIDTSNVLLVIELQSLWLQEIVLGGNTRDISFDLTKFINSLTTNNVIGKEFIVVQYYFGGVVPPNLGIDTTAEWFTSAEIIKIFSELKGAKSPEEVILLRNSLKARYTLSDEGFRLHRLNIDGIGSDQQFPNNEAFFKNLVTPSLNNAFNGYVNLDLISEFNSNSFKITGSNKEPNLEILSSTIIQKLDFYKNPAIRPFEIYYTNIEGDFTNTNYKLFDENGFISAFNPAFEINFDSVGAALPIWFKIVPNSKYVMAENNAIITEKIIEISNIDITKIANNPLTSPPDLRFVKPNGDRYYQGKASVNAYVKGTDTLIDSVYLNQEYPNLTPPVLKLEYNVSEVIYSADELALVVKDKSKWVDSLSNLKVGQYVIARVAINNPLFLLSNDDSMTSQIRVSGLLINGSLLNVDPNLILTNSDNFGYEAIDGQTKIDIANMVRDPNGNYEGVNLQMSVETEFYHDANGRIIVDSNDIPIIKRKIVGSTQQGVYKDSRGQNILDKDGNTIPIWVVKNSNNLWIPAPPLENNIWQPPQNMLEASFTPGQFSQEDTSDLQWRLFNGQFVRFSFTAKIGEGTITNPDFIFDTSAIVEPKFQLNNIKYPIQTNGISYRFESAQLEDIKYASDDSSIAVPYTGSSHISSKLVMIRTFDNVETRLVGDAIDIKIQQDFGNQVAVKIVLNRKNGAASETIIGTNLSQLNGLYNGDVITVLFESNDPNLLLPEPVTPLTILVEGLNVKPLDANLFKFLRPNFLGKINGSGSFNIRVGDPNNSLSTNETVLGPDTWYEYQVWNPNKSLKTSWTKDEEKITGLVNGDKIEWKIVNKNGVFVEDYYNTLLAGNSTINDPKFMVVNVVDNIENKLKDGIGNSNLDNPNKPDGTPQYPQNSGWLISGLKNEIKLSNTQKFQLEETISKFKPTFSGTNGFGNMVSNINNETIISPDVNIVWYTSSQDGMARIISDFTQANLSNGDLVWATIAPSYDAGLAGLIIDPSIQDITSEKFIVEGLRTVVNSSSQILTVSLITASSILFVGIVGIIIYVAKNKKLK